MVEPTASREFGPEEVGLALRNHGMLLEGLRYDVTPVGMHYLLVHFDVPLVDPETYALAVGGRVRNPLRLTLEDVKRRPALTIPVTMECSGNGRAHLSPRPISAPWREEAVGCAEWTGTSLGPILEEAGVLDAAVEIVFGGHDHGIDDGVEHDYERSMPVEEAMREEVLLVWGMNGYPLPSDLRVKVSATGKYTYPDVVVDCEEERFEDAENDTLLNPVVIIEILSQSTEAYDRARSSNTTSTSNR